MGARASREDRRFRISRDETVIAAKAAISAFYGEAPRRSYFNSCSNGGRQPLMEPQRYPEDYIGIVSGARLRVDASSHHGRLRRSGHRGPRKLHSPFGAIRDPGGALAACDTNDGVSDGVIEDPPSCRFDPGVLLCKGEDTAACLTAPPIGALQKLYGGPGPAIMPGYSPGGGRRCRRLECLDHGRGAGPKYSAGLWREFLHAHGVQPRWLGL